MKGEPLQTPDKPAVHDVNKMPVVYGTLFKILGVLVLAISGWIGWLTNKVDGLNPDAVKNAQKEAIDEIHSAGDDVFVQRAVPPGTIVAFAGDEATVPRGWVLCHGQAIDIRKDRPYTALRDAIGKAWGNGGSAAPETFNLPDLRGLFLRGVPGENGQLRAWTGNGYVVLNEQADPGASTRMSMFPGGNAGRAVGSVQPFSTAMPKTPWLLSKEPPHELSGGFLVQVTGHDTVSAPTDDTGGEINIRNPSGRPASIPEHGHAISGGDEETRPVNAYVNWIIKL